MLDLRKCFSTKFSFNRYIMLEALRGMVENIALYITTRTTSYYLLVFRTPFYFKSLSTLLLENIPLKDDDILYIHQLPSLSSLNLNNTDICNVGYVSLLDHPRLGVNSFRVFHLVALRRTLATLELGGNPLVTDDSASALLLLSRLRVLGLRGTTVTMTGLRRLVPFSNHLHLDAPTSCEQYLNGTSRP